MTTTYPVTFAGAGPGDPELITIKAQRALQDADIVIYAGSLVPEALLSWTRPEARTVNSAPMHLDAIVEEMAGAYQAGKRVVRLHTGDPSLYGAIFEQMAALTRRSIPFRIIPGVTAAFAAAAAMEIEYTLPDVSQTLILTRIAGRTPVPEAESLEQLARHRASMAIYLSMAQIEQVAAVLCDAYGKAASCAVAYRVSQPEEHIFFTQVGQLAQQVRQANITRQALIIVGGVLDFKNKTRVPTSKLYDQNFSHGCRD